MKKYLQLLHYGHMDVNPGNIDLFWLEGNSRITLMEQVDFIKRFYDESLPLSKAVIRQVKSIMINETTKNYTLSGKTGWAIRSNNNYGWFVGYLETRDGVCFFAALIEPVDQNDTKDFAQARKSICMETFRALKLIK